jgi:hypothetical protein
MITLFDMSQNKKDYLIVKLLKEKYLTDIIIASDGLEHYARLEMTFEDYFNMKLKEFNEK